MGNPMFRSAAVTSFRNPKSFSYSHSRSIFRNMSGFTTVSTPDAPAAIGPYSQAIKTDLGLILASGCIPLDPKSMEIVPGGVEEQTEQVFKNLKAVLAASGSDLSKIVKATVFLKDMNDFAKINAVYASHM